MIELNDLNFEKVISDHSKPVLVDFYANWCAPCFHIAPILERLGMEFENMLKFAKANLDLIPSTAEKLGIESIPTIVIFDKGKPVSGFVGLHPEDTIRKWILEVLQEKEGGLEQTIQWYEAYAKDTGFRLNSDKAITDRIVTGLLNNEKKYGKRFCPCRRVTGDEDQDKKIICPCIYHKEEIEKNGHCLCQLFFK